MLSIARFNGGASAEDCDDAVDDVGSPASIQDNGRSAPPPKSNVNAGMEGSSHSTLNLHHARPEVGTGGHGGRIGGEVG